jgi:hypothetical protein
MKAEGIDWLARAGWVSALGLSIMFAPVLSAQEAIPNTPQELKDFRLDKKSEPPKEAAPVIIVPEVKTPVKTGVEPTFEPSQRPTIKPPAIRSSKKAPAPVTIPPVTAPPITAPIVETPAPTPDGAIAPSVPKTSPVAKTPSSGEATGFDFASLPWWWIASGLAVAAFLLLGLGTLRAKRKRVQAQIYEEDNAPHLTPPITPQSVLIPEDAPARTAYETIPPPASPEPEPAKKVRIDTERPLLNVSFVPTKATVSVANLTITGQLRIINQGKNSTESMRLRAILISASEIQNDVIAAFHNDKDVHFTEDVGEIHGAERIAMEIELSIPLAELRSYPLGDQRLFVPIMLANIDYTWGKNGHDEAKLACLIGREATPPKPKMGPLRLDLGPRSFAPLGQRPVFG